MDLGLKGKVALITGGSEGIGKATALLLAEEGAKVVIAARRTEPLQRVAREIIERGGEALAVPTDVTQPADIQQLIDTTVKRWGRIDVLVNNAGASAAQRFDSIIDDAWQADLDLKLYAAIRCIRAALPHLREARGGRIVNVTTIGGKHPAAESLPSSLSRAAGIALTKALSKELAADGVLVNTVCIGLIKSDQHERRAQQRQIGVDQIYRQFGAGIPLGRVGEAEEAAKAIAFLVSSAASYITGASLNVDGGSSAVV